MRLTQRVHSVFRRYGVVGVIRATGRRLFRQHARLTKDLLPLVTGRQGLEIGGPSPIFERTGLLPVYPAAGSLDNANFSATTIWQGAGAESDAFIFDRKKQPGRQMIAEASNLPAIPDGSYDFLLASHALEHLANPIKALHEWHRVLRPSGALLIVLPDGAATFDHKRPVTPLAHMIEDFNRRVGEDDETHFAEVLALHDLARDPDAGGRARFEDRVRRNLEFRSVHHHVFNESNAAALVEHAGFTVLRHERASPHHLIVLGQKTVGYNRPQ